MSEATQTAAVKNNDVDAQQAAAASPTRDLFVKPNYHSSRVDGEWEIEIVVPGVKRKDVSVSLEEDELTIVGRRSDQVPETWRPLYEESVRADYRLRLQLNFDADPERISAQLEDGILKLRLPENESAKPRQIEVK